MFLKPIRKVLYVSSGQGVHDLRFVNLMKMAGWLVFYLRTDGMPNQKVDGVKVVEWVGNKFQISEINQQLFADSLLELEQSISPDVIQIGPLVPTAAALSESLQTPVLGVSWSRDLLYDLDLSNWSTEIAITAINRSDHLLVDCQTVARRAISLGANIKNISVIPWGVELGTFKFCPKADVLMDKSVPKNFKVISIRALEPLYRVSDLIESVRVLESRSSLPNLKVSIFSKGSDEANLRTKVKTSNLSEYFEFSGYLPESELPSVLSEFDVFVSTSPVDGSSISMLQAMATGLPCVVPDIESNREWIQDGLTGFLFEAGNATDLARVLEELSERPDIVKSVVESAREVVEKKADWGKGGQKLLRVLDRLASHL